MIAFKDFNRINSLPDIHQKHREWLKPYVNKKYSIAEEGKHKVKWATSGEFYNDSKYNCNINCVGRLKNRSIIEFDGDPQKAKEAFEIVKQKFKDNGWGYILSTHNSKKSDYLWIEFNRDMKDKEIEAFLSWVCPEGAEIDLNFASQKKVFPCLYAIHWKYSYEREMPLEYFEGEQIDFDSLNIPMNKKIKKTIINQEGFSYQTYKAAKVFNKKEQAKQFEKIQPLFYDKNGLWWLWNPELFKWEIVDEVDILNVVESATGADVITPKERTLILNSLKQEGRKMMPKQIKSSWIQFYDKIYDIETGDLIEASPDYFVTNPTPYSLNGSEETPTMDKIFEEWVGTENVQTLYEILAYCLIPDYPISRIFCFFGGGMNGKSKFLELLHKFIGKDNCCSTELDTLLNSRFEVTRLHKKLVCMMGETNFNEMSKTSILKKLSGGDLIGFEYKNKNPFQEKNYAKIIIATNSLPTTSDKTIGFYRRWMIVDFPNQFTEKKDILAYIPESEYHSLATKCCKILSKLLKNRGFKNEGTIEERIKNYENKSNFVGMFLERFTQKQGNGYITKAEFYRKFLEFCKENKYREMSEKSVSQKLISEGIESEKKYFNWIHDGKGGQVRCWIGIKWKDD